MDSDDDGINPLFLSEDECEDIESSVFGQPTLRAAVLAAASWFTTRSKNKVPFAKLLVNVPLCITFCCD